MKTRIRRRIHWGRWILFLLVLGLGTFGFLISRNAACTPTPSLVAGATPMNAILYRCYGPPEVLKLEQVAKPVPADDEVLVHVHASSVNPLDWHYMRGEPYIMRMQVGMGAPKNPRMGVDFSGTVEQVGKSVTRFKVGDDVFGGKNGAFGQYLTVRESRAIAKKPPNVSHEEAAALPIAAVTALQALRDQGHVKAGQKVLVNGASGGVGTYAVQLAKVLGASVTGVCSTRNVQMVASLGADRVYDYKNVDFVTKGDRYDVIIDTVGNRDLRDLQKVLEPGGIAVIVGGPSDGPWLGAMKVPLKMLFYKPFADGQFKFFLANLEQKDLEYLASLMESGRLKSVIDSTYPLAQVPAAIAHQEEGHARGKVVIQVQ
jgi:NADPH:quinone reductase-like Zn-dependent oxidoreductase